MTDIIDDPTTHAGAATTRAEALAGIHVIDVDTHLTEPPDLWTSRAPKKYRDLVPRVVMMDQESFNLGMGFAREQAMSPVWVVGEDTKMGFAGGGSVVNRDDVKVKGLEFINWEWSDVSLSASHVEPRLKMMDELGVWGQILYPNAVGFGGQGFARIKDEELRKQCVLIWNDAMADMQHDSGGRLNGIGMVPWWDRDLAVAEVQRITELGLHGFNLTSDPQNHGHPELWDPYHQPMWEAISASGLPMNFHVGGSISTASYAGTFPWPSMSDDKRLAVGSSLMVMTNARVIANLIFSGILDRNPTLQIVSVESGIGWIPFMLRALDYQADENGVTDLELKPSEYFQRQFSATFWFEDGPRLLEDINRLGVDRVMFETDFPHPTCLYPDPLTSVAQTFIDSGADAETRAKLLSTNAAKLYRIQLPAIAPGGQL